MSKYIIDRRENPKGKSTGNRQRFLKRSKKYINDSIRKKILERSITDKDGEEITIPVGDLDEPQFHADGKTGDYDRVLPGNDQFVVGDQIQKPKNGGGGGAGQGEAGDSGEGEDEFAFRISRDEYLDIVFENLELPKMIKKTDKDSVATENQRSGFVNEGNPAQLDLVHSMRNSLGRRIALRRRERSEEMQELIEELQSTKSNKKRKALEDEIFNLRRKLKAIPYIDPVDLRYRNYSKVPKPRTSAVMVCVMDVSASMGEKEKDLAKRFYTLLYLFLERKYQKVDVVFIRHHSTAKEVDEEEFFHSRETGGTMVSTGLTMAHDILNERYDWDSWNMYIAQCSDGDNFRSDMDKTKSILQEQLLPMLNHYFYIEIANQWGTYDWNSTSTSDLWDTYSSLSMAYDNLTAAKVNDEGEIVPVFREIFAKEENNE